MDDLKITSAVPNDLHIDRINIPNKCFQGNLCAVYVGISGILETHFQEGTQI